MMPSRSIPRAVSPQELVSNEAHAHALIIAALAQPHLHIHVEAAQAARTAVLLGPVAACPVLVDKHAGRCALPNVCVADLALRASTDDVGKRLEELHLRLIAHEEYRPTGPLLTCPRCEPKLGPQWSERGEAAGVRSWQRIQKAQARTPSVGSDNRPLRSCAHPAPCGRHSKFSALRAALRGWPSTSHRPHHLRSRRPKRVEWSRRYGMVLFASRARAVQSPEPKERHARADAASTGFRPAVSQLVASELQVVPSMPPSPLPLPPPSAMHPRRVDGALRSGVPCGTRLGGCADAARSASQALQAQTELAVMSSFSCSQE